MNIKKITLITGAGFSKNFGGFLAPEMWAMIFNDPEVQKNGVLRNTLINNYDYESVYESMMHQTCLPPWEDERRKGCKVLTDVIFSAYRKLDKIISEWKYRKDAPYPVNHYALDAFLNKFSGNKQSGKGFIFTLNQDLFFERKYINGNPFIYPGINYPYQLNEPIRRDSPLSNEMYITIPFQEIPAEERTKKLDIGNSFYIKLHGSFNWRDSDQQRLIITGQSQSKSQKIKTIGLLNWYWDILRNVLNQGDVKVLIIGYGFKDKHLNEVLEQAIFKNNLRIYIVSPEPFSSLRATTKQYQFHKALEQGLGGYFQTDLLGLFPTDQSKTQLLQDIEDYFFK